jgi:hypothetical protein
MSNQSVSVKILGRDVSLLDWIVVKIESVYRMGKAIDLRPHGADSRDALLEDDGGGRFVYHLLNTEIVVLLAYANEQSIEDDVLQALRIGTFHMCLKYARKSLDETKKSFNFSFTSRSGLLIFKDGSKMRIKSDESREFWDKNDVELPWPKRLARK